MFAALPHCCIELCFYSSTKTWFGIIINYEKLEVRLSEVQSFQKKNKASHVDKLKHARFAFEVLWSALQSAFL